VLISIAAQDDEALMARFLKEVPNSWTPIGLGRIVEEGRRPNQVVFVVLEWPEANKFRQSLGYQRFRSFLSCVALSLYNATGLFSRLAAAHFHITVSFTVQDVHNQPKDRSSLIAEEDLKLGIVAKSSEEAKTTLPTTVVVSPGAASQKTKQQQTPTDTEGRTTASTESVSVPLGKLRLED